MVKIYTSQVDISPDRPVYIRGHAMRKGKSQGIHDRLEATVCWFVNDDIKHLFINGDMSNWDYDFVHEFKKRICETLPVKQENIVLSATHTHSGPVLTTTESSMPHDEEYRNEVMDKLADAAISSYGKEVNVEKIICTQGESNGYYGNRNSKNKYGDNTIYMFEFKDSNDSNVAAFINISCHATLLSPEEYQLSGDLFGAIRRKMSNYLGVVPMMMNGNAGDMSNRLYRKNNDFAELDRVSAGIAHQIMGFSNKTEICLSNEKVKTFTFNVNYKTDKEALENKLEIFTRKLDSVTEYDDRKWIISEIAGFKRKLAVDYVDLNFETTIYRMGDLELVIIPGELVSEFGRIIKKTSSAKVCVVWGYANGQTTYIVEASEFNGGHDGIATNLPKGKAEEYVSLILQNLIEI